MLAIREYRIFSIFIQLFHALGCLGFFEWWIQNHFFMWRIAHFRYICIDGGALCTRESSASCCPIGKNNSIRWRWFQSWKSKHSGKYLSTLGRNVSKCFNLHNQIVLHLIGNLFASKLLSQNKKEWHCVDTIDWSPLDYGIHSTGVSSNEFEGRGSEC